jgi:hypothetical protein
MREALVRCKHCQDIYVYQMSGNNIEKINNSDYCSICYKHILESLKSIPVKYSKKLVPTTDITYEELIKQKEIDEAKVVNGNLLPKAIKIFPKIFNEDRQEYSITEHFKYKFVNYYVNYWPSTKENKTIIVETVYNNITEDFEGLWQDLN